MASTWRQVIDQTLAQHILVTQTLNDAENARRNAMTGGELHHLAGWLSSQASELQDGKRSRLEGPSKNDPPWVTRVKVQVRRATRSELRFRPRIFARDLSEKGREWTSRSAALLRSGSPPAAPRHEAMFPVRPEPKLLSAAPPKPAPAAARPAPAPPVKVPVKSAPAAAPATPAPKATPAPPPAASPAPEKPKPAAPVSGDTPTQVPPAGESPVPGAGETPTKILSAAESAAVTAAVAKPGAASASTPAEADPKQQKKKRRR